MSWTLPWQLKDFEVGNSFSLEVYIPFSLHTSCLRLNLPIRVLLCIHAVAIINDELEHIQKRVLSIIMGPGISYSDALKRLGIASLNHRPRRREMCDTTFSSFINNSDHKLHALLHASNANRRYSLRDDRAFHIPTCKTNRLENSLLLVRAWHRLRFPN